MAQTQKDTIYIDVDDEITTIIEKLQSSKHKIVALVLPKRAAVLQSIVNMKLLKRTAETTKKHVVLITSEMGLLPLAGAVGMHVAKSLQSKPVIPSGPGDDGQTGASVDGSESDETLDDEGETDFDAAAAAHRPIGQLAGEEPETIQFDNEDAAAGATTAVAGGAAAAKKGKNKKLKIPNFNKFRLIFVLAIIGTIGLIVGLVYANTALPKATITLSTNSTDVDTKANISLDPNAKQLNLETGALPAKIVSKQQTGSQQVSTSGQKNNGAKANGSVIMTSKICGSFQPPSDVPAGTGISSGGKTFITQSNTSFPPSGIASGGCISYGAIGTTTVIAQTGGSDYNIGASTFTVAGRSDVTAKSNDSMTGGTDNIIKVVTQADIDSAKNKIADQQKDNSTIKDDLTKKLSTDGYTSLAASLQGNEPTVTPSAAVGDQADTVTVTQSTTYTMYGYKKDDIKRLITASVRKQIDTKKQQILKDGADKVVLEITTPATSGALAVSLSATSLAGPDIQVDTLAAQFAGKKTSEVQSTAKALPGVTDAKVDYSPFWVSKVPKNAAKVTIVIEKAK